MDGVWDVGGIGAWRGSGGLCCLKKASVVAALVSESRRDGVERRGGDSMAALTPRPIDSLFIFLRCLRRSYKIPSVFPDRYRYDIGSPLPRSRPAPSLPEIPRLHACALPECGFELHFEPSPHARDVAVELQYVREWLDCVLEGPLGGHALAHSADSGDFASFPGVACASGDWDSWQWDGSEEG